MAERFQVDLRGVIDLLANHLYSSPDVFVRELLQNAVDAITARREIEPDHCGTIRFELVAAQNGPTTLVVEDDGIGLTEEEMARFLSTIGASSKRGDLEKQRRSFIGQFGIGILSCFMVSDEIVVLSRSITPGAASVEWRGKTDGTFDIRKLSREIAPGARVCLRLKSEGLDEPLTFERIRDLAARYGEMLPYRVTVAEGRRSEIVNDEPPPWEDAESDGGDRLIEYAKTTLGFEPLDVIPLTDAGLQIAGAAFVLPHAAQPGQRSDHRVYLKRMFLTERGEGLLPDWAFFVRCVLNAEALRPTASRESFYQDKALRKVSTAIGKKLRDYLLRLARRERRRLEHILAVHDQAIRALAVHDDEFFDVVIDLLPFETTLGRVLLGEYRREHLELRVAPTNDQFRQVAPVAAAQGIVVFNGGYTSYQELLEKASQRLPDLTFQLVTSSDLIESLGELSEAERDAAFGFLQLADEVLLPYDCTAEMRKFQPAAVPVIFGADLNTTFFRTLERSQDVADQNWSEVLGNLRPDGSATPRSRLCFNHACELVRSLSGLSDEDLQRRLIELLYVQALLLGQHPLSAREMLVLNRGLLGLIRQAVTRKGPTE